MRGRRSAAAAAVADPARGIELRGVGHAYAQRAVLHDLDLVLTEPRIGVVGANGSGKSTFARLLNGLVLPSEGEVLVDGLSTATQLSAVRRRVGFVFQDPDAQIVHPTVAEDVAFGLVNQGVPAAERDERVRVALERFGLAGHADHPAHLLSGGQKQLLAIAGVLVMRPARVVFDEPTTLLDLVNTRRVARLVASLEEQVLVVSHDLDLLADFDRVLVVDGGTVVADDAPAPALAHYRELMAART
ncbi:energy-coupling factor ABC transporter ATP-binding protein [Klenkia taihuensis]|uniref:Biotin transport system ATP-binding protein n=1 Tax=Klenkia taihuensis TaxID=1225127 RepID=A0A1I1S799_9ACTN|nr:ABC transporter ATP-binding protein [Klenkia taihuensis]GHE13630.1 putative ABC transporter ATP-binding protein [Klenkia taihuensis]SFD42381.1 biotin transport system ATP-binding protein [Klenkia taihuensis]